MYSVGNPPLGDKEFRDFILLELAKISESSSNESDLLRLSITYVAPKKPRNGNIRLADGTLWNPGAGAGFYGYRGGAWVLLG